MKAYYGAGVIVYSYDEEGRLCILLELRAKQLRGGGTWGIPGGGYEENKDGMTPDGKRNLKACAIRETGEETDLRIAGKDV